MVSFKFRADGSSEIGLGHLIRSKALADMLKKDFDVRFFCQQIPESIRNEFEQSGLPVMVIEGEEEYLNSLSESDLAIIDGYEFDIQYRKSVKASASRLICIDDLAKGEFVADLIINQSPGVQISDYSAKHYTEFALGPDYALLRSSFLQKESEFTEPKKRKNLLICFGGSDVLNITEKAVKLALDFKEFDKITIITGSAYSHKASLKNTLIGFNHCDYHHAVSEQKMAELMIESDAAIVPASGILFEALVTKNVVISGMYIDNQERNYKAFKKKNAIIDAGHFGKKEINLAFEQVQQFEPVDIVDGKSPGRLVSAIKRVLNRTYD
jgi:UDP-2,4-diacetamido-2,4,6-trideoxy-beta-L-altropyranose hydrolase